jgi:DNA-binding MarR family transcriptional regulator
MPTKPNRPSFDDERRLGIGRLLLMARRDFVARLHARLVAAGEPWHPSMMISSYVDSDGTRSGEIARRMGLTKQAVGRMVRDLEALGLLTQEPDAHDGRATRVRFTDAGLRYMMRMHRQIEAIEREYEALIGAEDFAAARKALRIVAYGERGEGGGRDGAGRSRRVVR